MTEDIYTILGRNIKHERLKSGFTQEELGELADIHYSFLGYIERGNKKASLKTIQKIANALNLPINKLFKSVELKPRKIRQSLNDQLEPLLRDRPRPDQEFIIQLVKTVVRKMDRREK